MWMKASRFCCADSGIDLLLRTEILESAARERPQPSLRFASSVERHGSLLLVSWLIS